MNDTDRINLSKFIKDPNLERLELLLKEPNLFQILKFESAEIRHSNFLAWLLDPMQNHGLGDVFIRRLLKEFFSNDTSSQIDEFTIDTIDLDDIEIQREWEHIDILINASKFVVCIENKVWSGEFSTQLSKYREIVNRYYPAKTKLYIYLTPHGIEPQKDEDRKVYTTYSYGDIERHLREIIDLYGQSLPDKIKHYISDYITLLKREIMNEEYSNELAKQIYNKHKEAIEFIIRNKPDRIVDVAPIFEEKVKESGWILETQNKGYTRFLTPKLHEIIPRDSKYGWKGNEAFLFEIDCWPKSISIKAAISPGDSKERDLLIDTISKLPDAGKPRGKQWIVYISKNWRFDITNNRNTTDKIKEKLDEIWPEITRIVTTVEKQILIIKDQLVSNNE